MDGLILGIDSDGLCSVLSCRSRRLREFGFDDCCCL